MIDLYNINLEKAAELIKNSKHLTAFTGAGISVESGIPSYRGEGGMWTKYDTKAIEINYFYKYPELSWKVIRQIFYDYFGKSKPNPAHYVLAEFENRGILKAVITQNIDNLHHEAGNTTIYEFHGNSKVLSCIKCQKKMEIKKVNLDVLPPKCDFCDGILKPDFIFFGEGIPESAYKNSFAEAEKADVFLLIGTTGLVQPAALIPYKAKQNGAKIIEINPEKTVFSDEICDIFLKGKAGEVLTQLKEKIFAE
jgi:NAD-dependent deacetylase